MGTGQVGLHGEYAQLHVVVEFNLERGRAQTLLLGMGDIIAQEMIVHQSPAILSIAQVCQ